MECHTELQGVCVGVAGGNWWEGLLLVMYILCWGEIYDCVERNGQRQN